MTDVPCNGCTACCKRQRIILGPEDDIERYRRVPNRRGNDGEMTWMLAHKPNGDCWYLKNNACSIHDWAPKVCRDFDCRVWFSSFPYPEQIMVWSDIDHEVAQAAKDRLS